MEKEQRYVFDLPIVATENAVVHPEFLSKMASLYLKFAPYIWDLQTEEKNQKNIERL